MSAVRPGKARWHHRLTTLTALVALLAAGLGAQALLGPQAGASGTTEFVSISGSGSGWSSSALEHWRRGAGERYGMAVNFSPDGSANGRYEFRAGTDLLVKTVPLPPACDLASALTQCASGTGGAAAMTTSTITLTVSPATPSAANTVQTLTATIRPGTVAGSVQFKDGSRDVGGPVAVSGGLASTTTTLAPGTHWLTAVFNPAEGTAASGSSSGPVSAVMSPPAGAKITATTFMAIPSGPVIQGTPVILVAQVMPANASGTIQFRDGDIELGLPRPVVGGLALIVTSKLTEGTHSLTAVFTATDQTAFGPSTPPPVSLTVIGLS